MAKKVLGCSYFELSSPFGVCSAVLLLSLIACNSDNSSYESVSKSQTLEDFESENILGAVVWQKDPLENTGPFSESGKFFSDKKVIPPVGYRASIPIGVDGFLVAELYSRSKTKSTSDFLEILKDPSGINNKVLKLSTGEHTDGVVIRSANPLPQRYQLSLKVGYPSYGDGMGGLNGYDTGDELAEPWGQYKAISENGFYWLAILDEKPKPHNNIWIHHHRKFVIDSDNHDDGWMEIFNGKNFDTSGVNPIMVIVPDGKGKNNRENGKPFISYSNNQWQPSGDIKAVDAYLPEQWYQVTLIRDQDSYSFKISGIFKFGGETVYEGSLNYKKHCIWHYNQPSEMLDPACIDNTFFSELGKGFPFWPEKKGYPDYLMIGDPHINYYEGKVYFDDISLTVLP